MSTRKRSCRLFGAGATLLLAVSLAGCSSNVMPPSSEILSPPGEILSGQKAPIQTKIPQNGAPSASEKLPLAKNAAAKSANAKSEIAWRENFENAQIEAKKSGKPLMVDFYTDWCSACKMMDAEAYPNANIVRDAKDFVMVKVNAEQRVDLAKQYKITGYPTILWLNDSGQVLNVLDGYGGVPMLQKYMKDAKSSYEPSA